MKRNTSGNNKKYSRKEIKSWMPAEYDAERLEDITHHSLAIATASRESRTVRKWDKLMASVIAKYCMVRYCIARFACTIMPEVNMLTYHEESTKLLLR